MTERVAVVGATGGIGAALVRLLVADGRAVHLIGRDRDRLAALQADCSDAGMAVCDVLDEAALATALAAAGPLAGLAFCVGSIVLKPLGRSSPADFIEAFRLNVVAAARAVALSERALRAVPGSAVVLFSSIAARAGFANHAVIGAAKAAVEGLTIALAAELAPAVRVNCIAPSLTRTALAAPLLANEAMARALAGQHPIPRLGEPADAAALAAFLLSPAAGWITGQVIAVDGGRSSLRGKG